MISISSSLSINAKVTVGVILILVSFVFTAFKHSDDTNMELDSVKVCTGFPWPRPWGRIPNGRKPGQMEGWNRYGECGIRQPAHLKMWVMLVTEGSGRDMPWLTNSTRQPLPVGLQGNTVRVGICTELHRAQNFHFQWKCRGNADCSGWLCKAPFEPPWDKIPIVIIYIMLVPKIPKYLSS